MNKNRSLKWNNERIVRRPFQLSNAPAFLVRLAKLIDEGYTFHEALTLLLPHHTKQYNCILEELDGLFRNGANVAQILTKLGFASNFLLPVVVAEVDGNLSRALHAIGLRLANREAKMKKLKSIVAYPIVLFIFLFGLFLSYRQFFIPNFHSLMSTRGHGENTFMLLFPQLVSRLPDIIIVFLILCFISTLFLILYYQQLSAIDRIQFRLRLPFIRNTLIQLQARNFAEEMGNLLETGLSLQGALDVLIEQQVDIISSALASNVRKEIVFGESFDNAILLTTGLTKELASFAKHGADRGELAKELELYARHLTEELERKMNIGLAMLQPLLFSIVAICILAAYLALLLPVYKMIDFY